MPCKCPSRASFRGAVRSFGARIAGTYLTYFRKRTHNSDYRHIGSTTTLNGVHKGKRKDGPPTAAPNLNCAGEKIQETTKNRGVDAKTTSCVEKKLKELYDNSGRVSSRRRCTFLFVKRCVNATGNENEFLRLKSVSVSC